MQSQVIDGERIPRKADGPETLEAKDIVVRFEGLAAIDGVSIRLRRREIAGLIGPNGAGKTTLVNVLTGFQRPDGGRVLLGPDEDVTGCEPHLVARKGIARTFQSVRLFKEFTVRENVEANAIGVGLSLRGARRRAMEILDWMAMSEKADLQAEMLPFGEERKVGVARALATHPHFILLDEPAAGLDDIECDKLMQMIAEIPEVFACGVLIVEHNMHVIMNVCQYIHVIDFGRKIAEGTPKQIQADALVIRSYLGTRER